MGSRRRRLVALVALGVILVVAALAVLAIPMRTVPGNAQAAKDDLTGAQTALENGDLAQARELVAEARKQVDAAQDGIGGFGGAIWSVVPVLGTPVSDARDLVQALDDATSVAEIGIDLYPSVAGKHATLFRDKQIDPATLARVIAGAHQAEAHLSSAKAALDDVSGNTPLVGGTIAARRDEAADVVDPLAATFAHLAPMLDRLPSVFGFDGKRSYLIAMLNPAELRYSGGASLTFAPLTFDQGKAVVGDSLGVSDDPRLQAVPVQWRGVHRNRFHHPGANRLTNATFAPSWSVSGEELLRAWQSARHEHHNGVIAIDVVGLARLVGAVGGISVPGYGELTEANLVKTVVGSYDQYYPDPSAQDQLNGAIIPAFENALFSGGDYVEKAQALGAAAAERHFALYFRDREVQDSIAASGLDGDLAEPQGDYLGAFTQNTNGSKVDYYQRRSLSLDVTVSADGSAEDSLEVDVHNDTPPYAVPGVDPKSWYFTRWAGLALGVFVPGDAQLEQSSLLGEPVDSHLRNFYRHRYVTSQMLLPPSSTGRFSMRYRVADAATVDEDGELTYRLAYDPQGTVVPQSVDVTVQLPEGYTAKSLPAGWSSDGRTVSFPSQELATSQQWEIVAAPGS